MIRNAARRIQDGVKPHPTKLKNDLGFALVANASGGAAQGAGRSNPVSPEDVKDIET